MDQMTGFEAVQQIREYEKGIGEHTPVVCITSLAGQSKVNKQRNKKVVQTCTNSCVTGRNGSPVNQGRNG